MTTSFSLESVLDELDDAFFVFDETPQLVEWNQTVVDVTGYSDEILTGMSPLEFFDPTEGKRVEQAIEELYETGRSTIEAELVTADGTTLPYEFKATRLPESGANSPDFVGIGRDLTELRAAEREREAIVDRMADAFLALDEGGDITYANEEAHTILATALGRELEPGALVGMNIWEEVPQAKDTALYEKHQVALETQKPITYENYYEPVDAWFEVRVYPSDTGLSVYFRDITERRNQREALERREDVLRRIYEVTVDRSRSFADQVGALLALGREELSLDYGTLSRIDGEDYIFEYVDAADDSIAAGDVAPVSATNCEIVASTQRTVVLGDVTRDAPDETNRAGYTEWGISCYIGAPVTVEEGVYGTFCFYDTEPRAGQFSNWEQTLVEIMSQWVSYELQHRRAKQTLERQVGKLDEFAGVLTHDLRNPLNVAQGRLDLARQDIGNEHLDAIEGALGRMDDIIDDVLSLARAGQQVGEKEVVDLSDLVDQCWRMVEAKDAELLTDIDLKIEADKSQLRHVIENLLRNAIEHGGDQVTITVGEHPRGFYFEDDGPGIPEEDRDDVFRAGYSLAEAGSGFGLAIVKEIVEAHGWEITVTESAEGGARFEFAGVKSAS